MQRSVQRPMHRSVRCSVLCSVRCSVRSLLLTLLLLSLLIGASCAASCAASYASERPVQRPVTSVSSFLRDLVSGLVPIFRLVLCLISWVFSYASRVLLMVLIVGSSCRLCPSHVLHPIELTKQFTYKFISPIWLCWSSNTKIQSKWA